MCFDIPGVRKNRRRGAADLNPDGDDPPPPPARQPLPTAGEVPSGSQAAVALA